MIVPPLGIQLVDQFAYRVEDDQGGAITRFVTVNVIRVVDTGRGIRPSHRAKIFEPGISTKARGWGMGLALVKRIVTQYHGGRIRVESTGPQGTVFAVWLPGLAWATPAHGVSSVTYLDFRAL